VKILVCFKVVPDLDKVVESDWETFSPESDLGYAGRVIGCFDDSALEIALRLRDELAANGLSAECAALTAGPAPASLCQGLYAAGFDRVQRIDVPGVEFAPGLVAALLSEVVKKEGCDLVLCGKQTGLADTGTVPYLLAEMCGMPVLGEAESIAPHEDGVSVDTASDGGRERSVLRLPAVVVVGNSPAASLRVPTLREKLEAKKRGIEAIQPHEATTAEKPALAYTRVRSDCRFISGESVRDVARRTAAEFLSSRVR
jgi:electron transfer flavoprotein beta subunit